MLPPLEKKKKKKFQVMDVSLPGFFFGEGYLHTR